MDKGYVNMMRKAQVELAVGVITLLWSLLSVLFKQPVMVHQLVDVMPAASWIFAGIVIGGAQITISRNPTQYIGTFFHWGVAFLSAIFWCYMGWAAFMVAAGVVPIIIFWATATATLWELSNV